MKKVVEFNTTIRVRNTTKDDLDNLKKTTMETYNDVIRRLIKDQN